MNMLMYIARAAVAKTAASTQLFFTSSRPFERLTYQPYLYPFGIIAGAPPKSNRMRSALPNHGTHALDLLRDLSA